MIPVRGAGLPGWGGGCPDFNLAQGCSRGAGLPITHAPGKGGLWELLPLTARHKEPAGQRGQSGGEASPSHKPRATAVWVFREEGGMRGCRGPAF